MSIDGDKVERTSYVCEKLQGKWPVEDEPSPKRKKTSCSSYREEVGVHIGGPAPHRRWRMVVSDSSNDDGAVMPPPPTTKTPPPATHAGAETREMRRAWEAIAIVPETS